MVRVLSLFALGLLALGCRTSIKTTAALQLKKGMDSSAAANALGSKPSKVHAFDGELKDYRIEVYSAQEKASVKRNLVRGNVSSDEKWTVPRTVYETKPYYLVFENDQLMYWGYPEYMEKHSHPTLRELATRMSAKK